MKFFFPALENLAIEKHAIKACEFVGGASSSLEVGVKKKTERDRGKLPKSQKNGRRTKVLAA